MGQHIGKWLVALAVMVGACAPGQADAAYGQYTVSLEDEWGGALRTFHHSGQHYAMGQYGKRYNVRVHNHTSRRVEVVLTVDGRDVVSGKKGDFRKQRGYLIDAHGSVLVEGFRTSLSEVAAFRFTSPGDSYSSRMGTAENVGVVGAAFFPERRVHRPRPKKKVAKPSAERAPTARKRRSSPRARPAPSAPASADSYGSGSARGRSASAGAPGMDRQMEMEMHEEDDDANNLGTQYGERHGSQVREVRFVRAHASRPSEVVTLRYDDRRGLLARGIQVDPPQRRHSRRPPPEAFPMSRFAPPPPPSYR